MQTTNMDPDYIKTYKKVLKMYGSTEIKHHDIVVLLLRLRQICCHPSLIVNSLHKENYIEEDGVDIDILGKLNNLNLEEDETLEPQTSEEPVELETFKAAASRLLDASNPVFAKDRPNEKIKITHQILKEKVMSRGDKIVIVSQWISMLQVMFAHLKLAKYHCVILDGTVPVPDRNELIKRFNDPTEKTNVLLLSFINNYMQNTLN
ncbi:lodestar [Carabus blaptoides fortunei]